MILTQHIVKGPGTVFSGKNLIAHERQCRRRSGFVMTEFQRNAKFSTTVDKARFPACPGLKCPPKPLNWRQMFSIKGKNISWLQGFILCVAAFIAGGLIAVRGAVRVEVAAGAAGVGRRALRGRRRAELPPHAREDGARAGRLVQAPHAVARRRAGAAHAAPRHGLSGFGMRLGVQLHTRQRSGPTLRRPP